MSRIVLVGGPFDGTELSTALGAAFLFTDGRRCFRAPARGRELYRVVPDVKGVVEATTYRFVGHEVGQCECGAFRRRRSRCPACGSLNLTTG